MARMRAPDGVTSASFNGVDIAIGDDGFAEVPDAGVEAMQSHGFVHEAEIAETPAETVPANGKGKKKNQPADGGDGSAPTA